MWDIEGDGLSYNLTCSINETLDGVWVGNGSCEGVYKHHEVLVRICFKEQSEYNITII